ncbi:MAG TPA: ATPase domain-containing protein, partial [Polyangia bacterium]
QGLKAWVDVVGCTVLLLTSSGANLNEVVQPEHTMVDGLIQFASRPLGMRMLREVCVRKFRGSRHLEGFHSYTITDDGIIAWPRVETLFAGVKPNGLSEEIAAFGIPRLDEMLDGGVRRSSISLLVGATGVGKTQLGLHFLAEGVARGEATLYFGLFEPPSVVERTARRLGAASSSQGSLAIVWQPDTERLPDALAADLLRALETTGARRLLVDGMVAFKTATDSLERLPSFFAALTNELRRRGVTTMFTEELRDVVNISLYIPVDNVSASCDNIVFLRQVEEQGRIVRYLSVAKTRASAHDDMPRRFEVTAGGIEVAASAKSKPARRDSRTRKRKR